MGDDIFLSFEKEGFRNIKNKDLNSLNMFNENILHFLIKQNKLDSLKDILLNKNINLNPNQKDIWNKTPLYYAIDKEIDLEIFNLLINHPNMYINIPCFTYKNENKIIEIPPLLFATESSIKYFNAILSHPDIDINSINYLYKTSLLHYCIKNNKLEHFKILVNKTNIDLNIINDKNHSILEQMLWTNKQFYIKYIDISKIDINYKNNYGNTILHTSCNCNAGIEFLTYLLQHPNINVNIQNNDRNTPLHRAVLYNKIEIVKLLLQKPEIFKSFSIRNDNNKTPINIAVEHKYEEILELLEKYVPINPIFFEEIFG